jgi:hypothetical protein
MAFVAITLIVANECHRLIRLTNCGKHAVFLLPCRGSIVALTLASGSSATLPLERGTAATLRQWTDCRRSGAPCPQYARPILEADIWRRLRSCNQLLRGRVVLCIWISGFLISATPGPQSTVAPKPAYSSSDSALKLRRTVSVKELISRSQSSVGHPISTSS